jgi:hypothetical protein
MPSVADRLSYPDNLPPAPYPVCLIASIIPLQGIVMAYFIISHLLPYGKVNADALWGAAIGVHLVKKIV